MSDLPSIPVSKHSVSEADVQHVAALANLELTPAELPAMRRDLNAILGYIDQLDELDTAAVEPMAQVSEVLDAAVEAPLRPDVPLPSLDRTAVLRSAPETDGVFFKLPRVMER
jgi:aspartyl-tRNA(Asn)/glutamyl-tRNA(Gln) amidotransferase subunit C